MWDEIGDESTYKLFVTNDSLLKHTWTNWWWRTWKKGNNLSTGVVIQYIICICRIFWSDVISYDYSFIVNIYCKVLWSIHRIEIWFDKTKKRRILKNSFTLQIIMAPTSYKNTTYNLPWPGWGATGGVTSTVPVTGSDGATKSAKSYIQLENQSCEV